MALFVWILPGTTKQYRTLVPNDPNVPAGYLLSNTRDGSGQFADGATDQQVQVYVGGINSGGYPAYNGDPTTIGKMNPNGILGG